MDSFSAYKERIGNALVSRLLKAIESDKIDTEESALVAGFLLDRLNQCTNNAQLLDVVTEASNQWPVFADILSGNTEEAMEAAQEQTKQAESQAINQASDLLKQNKIEEALQVIEKTNESTTQNPDQQVQPGQ